MTTPTPQRETWAVVKRTAWLLIAALAACSSSGPKIIDAGTTTSTSTVAPTPTTVASTPLTFSGDGKLSTDPFTLAGGDYRISWSFGAPCSYGVFIQGPLPKFGPDGMGPADGSDNLYGVKDGTYHLEVITGPAPDCPWSFTMTPR